MGVFGFVVINRRHIFLRLGIVLRLYRLSSSFILKIFKNLCRFLYIGLVLDIIDEENYFLYAMGFHVYVKRNKNEVSFFQNYI